MDYSKRISELSSQFMMGKDFKPESSSVRIRFCSYRSRAVLQNPGKSTNPGIINDNVPENLQFEYPVFLPANEIKTEKAILLLHGLNERNWCKYLPWAEYLCTHTGRAVILFPIAYHVNRSPQSWSNPKFLQPVLDLRRKLFAKDRTLSFANVALSERLSHNPQRFYESGKQSYDDIVDLLSSIRSGKHPFFHVNTQTDVFAYSIGALLSQVLFLSNPAELFSDAKLFLFCGGSVFNRMFGESRSIMDKISFERLFAYYQQDEWLNGGVITSADPAKKAFASMIASFVNKHEREDFFARMKNRIGGISLALDKVIPYQGVAEALGHFCAAKKIRLVDFPYEYTHENPFPVFTDERRSEVNIAFENVFKQSVEFFCH